MTLYMLKLTITNVLRISTHLLSYVTIQYIFSQQWIFTITHLWYGYAKTLNEQYHMSLQWVIKLTCHFIITYLTGLGIMLSLHCDIEYHSKCITYYQSWQHNNCYVITNSTIVIRFAGFKVKSLHPMFTTSTTCIATMLLHIFEYIFISCRHRTSVLYRANAQGVALLKHSKVDHFKWITMQAWDWEKFQFHLKKAKLTFIY